MSLLRSIVRIPYKRVRDVFMVRSGLQPRRPYNVSETATDWTKTEKLPEIQLPNVSKQYNPILRAFWDRHALGTTCLLVSENNHVRSVMCELYPTTEFTTCDFFPELQPGTTDYIWDVCMPPPPELARHNFTSVIANALVEHVIDPTCAMSHFFSLLEPQGILYGMTHTPSFHLHRYPKDYCRFNHDWFEDLPAYTHKRFGLAINLVEMYSFDGVVSFAYRRRF